MRREHHRWFTHRLGRDMDILVYGHYGPPIMVFPTSGGDQREYEGQSMIRLPRTRGGKASLLLDSLNNESGTTQGTPAHGARAAMYDDVHRAEVCRSSRPVPYAWPGVTTTAALSARTTL